MRKDLIFIGIIIVLLTIVFYQSCSGPDPYDEEKETYLDSVKVLQSEKATLQALQATIISEAREREKKDSSKLAASLREISRLRAKATTAVQNIPVRVMEEYPEVPIALAYLDSVNQKQAILIDTLQNQLQFERNVRENLVALHYDQAKIETQMSELKDARIISLERDLKNEKRKGKLVRVLIPVVGIAGFLLGAQL